MAILPDLSSRVLTPERMDQPGLDPAEHRRALAGLANIERVRRSASRLWREIARCAVSRPGETVRVLDVACGGGDVAAEIGRRARRLGLAVEVAGCDRSAVAIASARRRAERAGVAVRLRQRDVLVDGIPEGYDVIASNLFLHHLSDEEAVRLLADMRERAGRAVWIDDLARSRLGWLYTWVGCRLLTRSETVHYDSLRSVEAAFTAEEARRLAQRAGLGGARFEKAWPERWILTWRRA